MVRMSIIVIIIISVLLAVALNVDDDIDPRVSEFVSSLGRSAEENEGYFYLMGISAPEGEPPSALGRKHYETVSEITPSELLFSTPDLDGEVLPLLENDLFCNFLSQGCFEQVFHSKENLQGIIDEHAVLLARWKHYVAINDFETITSPSMFEVFPPYIYVTRANRVLIIESINDLRENRSASAIKRITRNIRDLRRQLVLQDNLLGKLVIGQLVSEHLDVLFLLIKKSKGVPPLKIALLSDNEKSLRNAIVRELAMALETYRIIGNHPELWTEDKNLPSWMGQYIFKPNMSINAVFPLYHQAAEYAGLDPIAFEKAMSTGPDIEPRSSVVRNFFGAETIQFASVNFHSYLGEFNDLNIKIKLFNRLIDQEITEALLQTVYSPYYETNRSATFSKEGDRVCVDGPLRDDKNMRCLKVKILAAEPS